MGGGNGSVDEDGNPVEPYGGPTTGDVADGIRDVVGDIQQRVRGKAKPDARAEPTAKAREVDCSQMPGETACNECLLKEGFIVPAVHRQPALGTAALWIHGGGQGRSGADVLLSGYVV
ncbi:hypothetical protein G6F50_013796 [Rhizopus delemar]|uniref:Uncharacterized protein n=1 Tax=Rhizopus delemar TaxID=936053 RepID=A0A9P6YCN5_9FUNG|nr:hypothetical protein G6F50_013796 [Rhizopus delemar]